MKMFKPTSLFILGMFMLVSSPLFSENNTTVSIVPRQYQGALKNPLKGFTSNNNKNPWTSITHSYIRWNEIENHESDGIEKILSVCNEKWKNLASENKKTIPRVYLHWDGDKKYWPSDMKTDDYESEQFKQRVVRLIERLGIAWDNDPRVAFVELGIIGKWGEHHSPAPSSEIQKIIGEAFMKAFKNKKVSVRHNWRTFTSHPFGEYWDSWAHYDQMWTQGKSIANINQNKGRYLHNYVGGEVAYNWGNWQIQPGVSPTASVSEENHRNFMINSIRWLHCTQLRWISEFDTFNPQAMAGAEEIQKVFGYRFLLNEVRISLEDSLSLSFDVTNEGSAPFYYDWPVEVALLDSASLQPVWSATMNNAHITQWHPGKEWTAPDWTPSGNWAEYYPDVNWNESGNWAYKVPAKTYTVAEKFKIDAPKGNYVLSLAVLDPAGKLPSLRFATANYLKGGRHPLAYINTLTNDCKPLPDTFDFFDPAMDNTLHYDAYFDVSDLLPSKRKAYNNTTFRFPGSQVMAWQYDEVSKTNGERYFALDSGITAGIYGCNDTSGINIRSYHDAAAHADAAQFNWNESTQTFQKHGQWMEYTVNFSTDDAYQIILKTQRFTDARLKLTLFSTRRDTIFHQDLSLANDFIQQESSEASAVELLSKFALKALWGQYIVRLDWYNLLGEPGILSSFSFIQSSIDFTPPEWYYVSIGKIISGNDLVFITTEDAEVYVVPANTPRDSLEIISNALGNASTKAYKKASISTDSIDRGNYILFAIDEAGNISEPTANISIEYPVNSPAYKNDGGLKALYNEQDRIIAFQSTQSIKLVCIYQLTGEKMQQIKPDRHPFSLSVNHFQPGLYLIETIDFSNKKYYQKISIY